MPITLARIQDRILARTGDLDPVTGDPRYDGGGVLASAFQGIWDEYADKAHIAPRLQELFTERDLYDLMIATIQDKYDFSDEQSSFKRSQRVATLVARRDKVIEKINETLAYVRANRAPAVGQLTTTQAVNPPFPFGVNADSPRYGGSPYTRKPTNYP